MGDVNKLFFSKVCWQCPGNVLPLHLNQTFLTIIWIFIKGEVDGNESRLPFKSFSTLLSNIGDFWLPTPLLRRHSLWMAPYIYYVKWSVAWWWLVKSFMLERSVILWSFIENLCASAWLMPYIYTLCPFLGFTFQNNSFLSELSFGWSHNFLLQCDWYKISLEGDFLR